MGSEDSATGWNTRQGLLSWWLLLAAATVVVRLLSTGVIEGGDGIQHYQIARYAWQHPELFLDHWGKPLFTLFASPFAQLGHWGMTLFNALCFVATCWAADGMLKRAGNAARWIFPPALLLVPVYGSMVLAGMTEVFFGMLAMLIVRCLFEERFALASVLVSFTPFARPEFIGFVPFVLVWIITMRQWRSLPFLLTGPVLYAVVGGLVLGDVLWYLHRDPYAGATNIYGSGAPFYFTDHIQNIYGAPLVWGMALSVICAIALWLYHKEHRTTLMFLLVVGVLPCVAIIGVHSFLWWKGLKGSLGLLRVIATTAPLAVLWVAWPVQKWSAEFFKDGWRRALMAVTIAISYLVWALSVFLNDQPLPVAIDGYQHFMLSVGQRVGELSPQYSRVVYYHPLVAYHAQLDPYDEGQVVHCWGLDTAAPALGLKPNDLLVWDAHFGPNEGRTPLNMLLARTDLDLIETMVPAEHMTVLGGYSFEAYLFVQREAHQLSSRAVLFDLGQPLDSTVVFRADTLPCINAGSGWCLGGSEFPFEITQLPLQHKGLFNGELLLSGEVEIGENSNGLVEMAFVEEEGANKLSYWSNPLHNGHFEFRYHVPPRDGEVHNKLYIWDRSGKGVRIKGLHIELVRHYRAE